MIMAALLCVPTAAAAVPTIAAAAAVLVLAATEDLAQQAAALRFGLARWERTRALAGDRAGAGIQVAGCCAAAETPRAGILLLLELARELGVPVYGAARGAGAGGVWGEGVRLGVGGSGAAGLVGIGRWWTRRGAIVHRRAGGLGGLLPLGLLGEGVDIEPESSVYLLVTERDVQTVGMVCSAFDGQERNDLPFLVLRIPSGDPALRYSRWGRARGSLEVCHDCRCDCSLRKEFRGVSALFVKRAIEDEDLLGRVNLGM